MIKIVAAVDAKLGFGKDGKIPWRFPADLKHFKSTTMDNVCIFGRKTYEDMGSYFKKEFLPGRIPIVVSSSSSTKHPNVIHAASLASAIDISTEINPYGDIALIGGRQIFEEGLKYATDIHLTRIDRDYNCDVFFPEFSDHFKPVHVIPTVVNGININYYHYRKHK